jgi:large subunit ribosomal protein L10
MINQTKIYEVENIKATLAEAKSAALIDYQGLTAEQGRQLRQKIKEGGGTMTVAKNTLISIALKQIGIELPAPLTGPTALVVSNQDEVAPLKAVDETRKQFEKPEFKLGIFQGKILPLEELQKLISLPTKEVLLAQFVGGLANPLQRLVQAMKYNQTKLVLVLKAVAEKN